MFVKVGRARERSSPPVLKQEQSATMLKMGNHRE